MENDKYNIYNKAKKLSSQAVQLDQVQEYEEAYKVYLKVLDLFVQYLALEQFDMKRRADVKKMSDQYIVRAQQLKQFIRDKRYQQRKQEHQDRDKAKQQPAANQVPSKTPSKSSLVQQQPSISMKASPEEIQSNYLSILQKKNVKGGGDDKQGSMKGQSASFKIRRLVPEGAQRISPAQIYSKNGKYAHLSSQNSVQPGPDNQSNLKFKNQLQNIVEENSIDSKDMLSTQSSNRNESRMTDEPSQQSNTPGLYKMGTQNNLQFGDKGLAGQKSQQRWSHIMDTINHSKARPSTIQGKESRVPLEKVSENEPTSRKSSEKENSKGRANNIMEFEFEGPGQKPSVKDQKQKPQQQEKYPSTKPQQMSSEQSVKKFQDSSLKPDQAIKKDLLLNVQPDTEPQQELTSQEKREANSFSDVYSKIMKNSRAELQSKFHSEKFQNVSKKAKEQPKPCGGASRQEPYPSKDQSQPLPQQDNQKQQPQQYPEVLHSNNQPQPKISPSTNLAYPVINASNNQNSPGIGIGIQNSQPYTNLKPQNNQSYPNISSASAQQKQYPTNPNQDEKSRFPKINHVNESQKAEPKDAPQNYPDINFLSESQRFQNQQAQGQSQKPQYPSTQQANQQPAKYPATQGQDPSRYPSTQPQEASKFPQTQTQPQLGKKSQGTDKTQDGQQNRFEEKPKPVPVKKADALKQKDKVSFQDSPPIDLQSGQKYTRQQQDAKKEAFHNNKLPSNKQQRPSSQSGSDKEGETDPYSFENRQKSQRDKSKKDSNDGLTGMEQFMGISNQASNASSMGPNMYSDLLSQRTFLKGRLTSLKPGDKIVLQGKLAKEIEDLDNLLGGLDSQDSIAYSDNDYSSFGNSSNLAASRGRQQYNNQLSQIEEQTSKGSFDSSQADTKSDNVLKLNQMNLGLDDSYKGTDYSSHSLNIKDTKTEDSADQNKDFTRKRFGGQSAQQLSVDIDNDNYRTDTQHKQQADKTGSNMEEDTFDSNMKPNFKQSGDQYSRLMGYDSTVTPMSFQSVGLHEEKSMNIESQLALENQNKVKQMGKMQSFKKNKDKEQAEQRQKEQEMQMQKQIEQELEIQKQKEQELEIQKQKEQEMLRQKQKEQEEQERIKQEELLVLQRIERINENNEIDELFQVSQSQFSDCESPQVHQGIFNKLQNLKQSIVGEENANNQGTQVQRSQQIQEFKNMQSDFLQKIEDYQLEQNKIAIENEQKEKRRQQQEQEDKKQQEKLEQERMQNIRLEQERLRKEKIEQERLYKQKVEQEKMQTQKQRDEQLHREKMEQERVQRQRQEEERLERERVEQEKLERLEQERLDRIEKERLQRVEYERQQREQREREQRQEEERLKKMEAERIQMEKVQKERMEQERQEKERLERLEQQRMEKEKQEQEMQEKIEQEKQWQIKMQQEIMEQEKLLQQNKAKKELQPSQDRDNKNFLQQQQGQLADLEQEFNSSSNFQRNKFGQQPKEAVEVETYDDEDNIQVESDQDEIKVESDSDLLDKELEAEADDKFGIDSIQQDKFRKDSLKQDLQNKQQQLRQSFSISEDLNDDIEVDQVEDDHFVLPPQHALQQPQMSLASKRLQMAQSKQFSYARSQNLNRQQTFDNQAEVEYLQESNSLLVQIEKYHINPDTRTQLIMGQILEICFEIDALMEQNYSSNQYTFEDLDSKNIVELTQEEQISGVIDELYVNPQTIQDVKTQLVNSFNNVFQPFVYLYGAPGTGKSILSQVISRELGAKYIEVDTYKLCKLPVIQAIQAIDTVFAYAREQYIQTQVPIVINFDEFDRLFEKQNQVTNLTYISARLVQRWLELKFEKKIDYEIVVVGVTRKETMPTELFSTCIDIPIYVQTPGQSGRFQYFTYLIDEMTHELKQEEVEAIIFSCKYYTFNDLSNLCSSVWEQQMQQLEQCTEFMFDNQLQIWKPAIGEDGAVNSSMKDLAQSNARFFIQPNEGYMYLIGENDEKTKFLQLPPAKYDMFLNSQLNNVSLGQETKEDFDELDEKIKQIVQERVQ